MAAFDGRGQSLSDTHPFKGGTVIFRMPKPVPRAPIMHYGPSPLPEWNGPVQGVFSLDEESRDGGSSSFWVERRGDEYVLFGSDLGQMSEPYLDPISALTSEGTEFGMEYIDISHPCRLKSSCKPAGRSPCRMCLT